MSAADRDAHACVAAVLGVYPESIIGSTVGEILTILAGILLLFIPMSVLIEVLVPDGDSAPADQPHVPRFRPALQWIVIALLGIGIGGALLVGLSIAYVFLRTPLALFRY